MKAVKMLILMLLPLVLLINTAIGQEESKTVTAEGVAVIQDGRKDIARDAAIQDALQRAVEQAIGVLIDSQTQVENYQVISDKILSQTKGYIKRYNITSQVPEENLLRVTINAEVSLGRLSDDLSAIGIVLGQLHKPRTMILVAEQNIGQEWHAWWWGGAHAQQTDMAIVENTLMDKFNEKGFEMIDHAAAAGQIKVTAAYNVQDLSATQAQTLGNQAAAEVVIYGKAVAKLQGHIGSLQSVQSNLALKAVRTDTGQVLASATTNAAAVHVSEITAGNEALKKAAEKAAEQLTTKILALYSKEVGGTKSVNITVTGLNKTQFVKFKDVLKNQIRGVKEIHERSFSNGVAKVSVEVKGTAQTLSDEISLKDFGSFGVEITASTANTLELRVVPPGGSPVMTPQSSPNAPGAVSAESPAAMPAAIPAAAPAASNDFFEGDEYLTFSGDRDKRGHAGKMMTPSTATHPEAEFLMYNQSRKEWNKFYTRIRKISPSEVQVGMQVVFFEGNQKESIYFAPADRSEAKLEGWWRDLITDTSLLQGRGIVTVNRYKVDNGNLFIETK